MPKNALGIILFLIFLAGVFFLLSIYQKNKPKILRVSPAIKETAEGKIKYPQDYTFVFVGDSMTEKLGNFDELREYLQNYYPDKTFEILNYGFGSTNILSVYNRLVKETVYGRKFRPVLDIEFDIIFIESFGNNPLSQFPLNEGLKKQTEALDKITSEIKKSNPKAKIVFVSTISPNSKTFALGQLELTDEKRLEWVMERKAYLKNHIDYARTKNIPVIDIYNKSLNEDGDGNIEFIDSSDNIHPSPSGVYFISREIADFIYNQKLLGSD
ncbi:SGNH/GDSL hydrolase family protein [Candidatus Daviesbacteria bacterium]|nr:SGNH/GDSL hydrolase family protein [Candidatus Daviesbacteria bacterium]